MDKGAIAYKRFVEEQDENGLVEIICEYRDGLTLYLAGIAGDLHAAEELAEDTFVILGVKKPSYKPTASFKTWLYTIGRNRAIDYLRDRSKRREVSTGMLTALREEEEDLAAVYLREEQKRRLHGALHTLKAEYRQVLWLTYFEGFGNKETAQIMKKSTHGVEVLLSRARKALRKQLEQEGFVYEEL